MAHKEQQVNINFNLTQINYWCIIYNHTSKTKSKNKLCMKAINYACFKLKEKATKNIKKNKSNFIHIKGDKFGMSVR